MQFDKDSNIFYIYCMKMSTVFIQAVLIGCILHQETIAQISHVWTNGIGSNNNDETQDIATDGFGYIYATGSFLLDATVSSSDSIIEEISSEGGSDIFVAKYSTAGALDWALQIGGPQTDAGTTIAVDAGGNIYISGVFSDAVDFDPGAGVALAEAKGLTDIFLLKLNSTGEFQWLITGGDDFSDDGRALELDSDGYIYLTGGFRDSLVLTGIFGTTILVSNSGTTDVFLAKFDEDGNAIWGKRFGGSATDNVNDLTIKDDRIILCGEFGSNIDLDASGATDSYTSAGLNDIFLTTYTTDGDYVWGDTFGSNSVDISHALDADFDGNIYLTGNFWNTVNFNTDGGTTNVTSISESDIFLAKFDSEGNNLWAISTGGPGSDESLALTTDITGSTIISGAFSGSVDFDPGIGEWEITSGGYFDIFLVKFGPDAILLEAGSFPSPYSCYGLTLTTDVYANLLAGGKFQLTVDFDPGIGEFEYDGEGGMDAYICKYSYCLPYSFSSEATICAGEVYEFEEIEFFETGTYTINYISAEGCDSSYTLSLIVTEVNTDVVTSESTLTASNEDATYQWLDCSASYSPITGATDQSYTATTSGSYAVEVTQDGCIDTSTCMNITVTPLNIALQETWYDLKLLDNNFYLTPLQPIYLSMYNINGELLSQEFHSAGTEINLLFEFPSGFYIYNIKNYYSGEIVTEKLIKW